MTAWIENTQIKQIIPAGGDWRPIFRGKSGGVFLGGHVIAWALVENQEVHAANGEPRHPRDLSHRLQSVRGVFPPSECGGVHPEDADNFVDYLPPEDTLHDWCESMNEKEIPPTP